MPEADIINLKPVDSWLFSIDVFRCCDGTLEARLADARTSLIESHPTESHRKLSVIADMLEQSIPAMRASAALLK